LRGEFADIIHLCSGCGYFQLNFREVCPRCRSANLTEEMNIHHFRCGYVGGETEFPDMRCPKCRRRLKHIGVDYDLPSVSFRCFSCKEVFGEPQVANLCIKCGKDTPVEETLKRIVRSYFLTPEGKRYAVDGRREISSLIKSELGLLEFEVFKEIFSVQTAITERSGKNFLLILVRGTMSESPGKKIEKDGNISNLTRQSTAKLREILRTQDIITAPPDGGILALAAETSREKADCIAERIRGTFAGSFRSSFQPTITFFESNGTPLKEALEKLYNSE
jgi:hypothetical protein